jgi:hypothetical protein
MEPTPSDIVQQAIDALLMVVEKSSADLRTFHDTVARARFSAMPRLPRATVAKAASVVEHLRIVDQELREVLFGLGLVGE